ncbi:hypothetical protein BJX66DRAFT_323481 [Aspergillus keveii]|uniref:Protein kinase domain-containing protein n=1 Tax=Aspergillus keveii TaxID=714993 RepID=A0ABR4GE42_9EURO
MRPINYHPLDRVPADIVILRELKLQGQKCVMKLFYDNGDPGIAENGRDLNRFRCELNAYMNLQDHNVCEEGFPALRDFTHDKFHPRAILLEYLANAESLNCENYPDACYHQAIEGIKRIHEAHVHQDVYPKNILLIDSDVATTFSTLGPEEQRYSSYEDALVAGYGEALRDDQKQGLPKNTKWY